MINLTILASLARERLQARAHNNADFGTHWVHLTSGDQGMEIFVSTAEHAERIAAAMNWRPEPVAEAESVQVGETA